MGILLYAKVSPFYNVLWEYMLFIRKVHFCNHFDRLLHIESSEATCVQNFRLKPLTVFDILGFKLKDKNDNKNNGYCPTKF